MKFRSTILLGALAVGQDSVVYGQAGAADRVQQAESFQRRQQAEQLLPPLTEESAPELFVGELKDVGPQSILKVKPKRFFFEAGADSQFFYTSNMFLEEDDAGRDPTDTTVFINTVQLATGPVPYTIGSGRLEPRVGFRYTFYNYGLGEHHDVLKAFDFDSQTLFGQVRYQLRGGWVLDAGLEWTQLTDHDPDYFDRFYSEVIPRWGVTRLLALSETRYFTLGYEGTYRFTDTEDVPDDRVNDRTDQVLFASYTHGLTPRLVIQPYYRFQYSRYTNGDNRDDFTQTTGCSIYYAVASWFGVRVFGSYERRDSDDQFAPDYHKFDGGLGVSVVGRF